MFVGSPFDKLRVSDVGVLWEGQLMSCPYGQAVFRALMVSLLNHKGGRVLP